MKKIKFGFTLAETLLALTIIAIIATLGLKISSRGIERAYHQYIYTGYSGITVAINDTVTKDYEYGSDDFYDHIKQLFDAERTNVNNIQSIIAPNNVQFNFYQSPNQNNNGNNYLIEMTIPTKKKKVRINNAFQTLTKDSICFIYNKDRFGSILIPFDNIGACSSTILDLLNRKDLLPFYLDDGVVGKVINGEYNKKRYTSMREAFCSKHGPLTIAGGNSINYDNNQLEINCQGIQQNEPNSIIRVENPRKAF